MRVDVTIDSAGAANMLDQLAQRTRGRTALWPAIASATEQGVAMISGVAHDTGELAGSVTAAGRDGPGLIVAEAEHARFVFGGAQGRPPNRPNVPGAALASILADEVARAVFG